MELGVGGATHLAPPKCVTPPQLSRLHSGVHEGGRPLSQSSHPAPIISVQESLLALLSMDRRQFCEENTTNLVSLNIEAINPIPQHPGQHTYIWPMSAQYRNVL